MENRKDFMPLATSEDGTIYGWLGDLKFMNMSTGVEGEFANKDEVQKYLTFNTTLNDMCLKSEKIISLVNILGLKINK